MKTTLSIISCVCIVVNLIFIILNMLFIPHFSKKWYEFGLLEGYELGRISVIFDGYTTNLICSKNN
jgi:hypothetical protein